MGEFISAHNKHISQKATRRRLMNASDPAWMSADFDASQKVVKVFEGGYSSTSQDRGNWTGGEIGAGELIGTNWGISAPVLVSELKRLGLPTPKASTMKALSYKAALGIYKRNYWAPIKGDAIKNQNLATILYDTAVNQGVGKAQGYVKDSLGTSSYDVNKINSANAASLSKTILDKRRATYKQIGGYALESWLGRLDVLSKGVQRNLTQTVVVALGLSAIIGGI